MLTIPWWGWVMLAAVVAPIVVIIGSEVAEERRKKGRLSPATSQAIREATREYATRKVNLLQASQTETGAVAQRTPDQPTTMAPALVEQEAERSVPRYYPSVEAERNAITPPAGTPVSTPAARPARKRKKAPKKAPAKRKPKKAAKRK